MGRQRRQNGNERRLRVDAVAALERGLTDHDGRLTKLEQAPETPWFKTPAVIVSVLALLVSVGGEAITARHNQASSTGHTREQIQTMITDMISLDREDASGDGAYRTDTQILVLLDAVARSERELSEDLSFHEYSALGDMESTYGNPAQSQHYFEQAARMAASPLDRAEAYHALAVSSHAANSEAEALAYLARAERELAPLDGDDARSALVVVYAKWADFLQQDGDLPGALARAHQAVSVAKRMDRPGPDKSLGEAREIVRKLDPPPGSTAAPPAHAP